MGLLFLGILSVSPTRADDVLQEVIVAPGDTMWGIANKYLKDPLKWPEIIKYNKLPTNDPTIALPGTRIKIPVVLVKEEFRTAKLVSAISEVKYQRKGTSDWTTARQDMTLYYEDSLRTLQQGRARVQFPSKEIVQINENSYVVLKPEKILQEIELLKGDIRASRARVILPHGTIIQPKGAKSDYQAKIREDETEVVFVYKGQVDVTAQGKTVTVPEGFGTQVLKKAPPQAPMPLNQFADFNPANLESDIPIQTKVDLSKGVVTIAPPVTTNKKEGDTKGAKSVMSKNILASYQLQLARDENFRRIILDITKPIDIPFDYKKQPISDGDYYMRVAFIDALGVHGKFSDPMPITKDTVPPTIYNLVPNEGQSVSGTEPFVEVKGTVSGATMLSVNGEVVFISGDGSFSKVVPLSEGTTMIEVLARDVAGNVTTIKRKVLFSRGKK